MQFWKKPKKIEYRFQNSSYDDATWVEITAGKYKSVVFSYGMVKFQNDLGMPKLSFDYTVLYSGEHDKDTLYNDNEFVTIIGDILTEIIIENEPTRTDNTEEFDLQ